MVKKSSSSVGAGKGKDSAGFYNAAYNSSKITANSVLVMSFAFMGFVILMHIWGKIKGGSNK